MYTENEYEFETILIKIIDILFNIRFVCTDKK